MVTKWIIDISHYKDILKKSNIRKWDNIVFCDIDWTIFRDSLYIEIFTELLKEREWRWYDVSIYENAYYEYFNAWKDRAITYDEYLKVVINCFTDVSREFPLNIFDEICDKVLLEKSNRTYVYPIHMLYRLQESWYKIILISWSPENVVSDFAKKHWFDVWLWSHYFTNEKNGEYVLTGDKIQLAFADSKDELVSYIMKEYTPENTIAFWDTNWDVKMLKKVNQWYAINPSCELYKKIKDEKTIDVIIERKDLVLVLKSDDRKYIDFFTTSDNE